MTTAQQLIDLSTQLTAGVAKINAFVGAQPLPLSDTASNLANTAAQIAVQANAIGAAGIAALAADVGSAITSLTFQVQQANNALAAIEDVEKVFNIASAVLSAAASIATSVGTGNWIGAASAVVTLASNIHKSLSPSTT
jgi:hypothetical protein